MGKKKNKQQREMLQQGVSVPETFDYQKLADALVNAQLKAKKKENKLTEQKNKEADAEWRRIIGYKEYDARKKWPIKVFYALRNDIVLLYHILFFKKENAKYDVVTFALLKLSLSTIFALFKFALYLIAIAFLVVVFYPTTKEAFSHCLVSLCFAFLSFMIARVFRIAQFEIENMKERELFIGILSTVTSFVAMVVAILSLLK